MSIVAHLVNAQVMADGIEEVIAGIPQRGRHVLFRVGIVLALHAVPDPAFRRVAFGCVLGEHALAFDLVLGVDLPFGQNRRRDAGLEGGARSIGAQQRPVEERRVRRLHQLLILFDDGRDVIGRPAGDCQRLAGVDLDHHGSRAGNLVLHLGVILSPFHGLLARLVSVEDHGVDRVVENTLGLLLQDLVDGQINVVARGRLGLVNGGQDGPGVVLGLDHLAVPAVQVFLEGVFHAVLADHGVIGVVQQRIALVLFLGHEARIAEDMGSVFGLVVADVGALNLNADQLVFQNRGNERHAGILNEKVVRRIDGIAHVDGVTDARDDAHLFAGIPVVYAVAGAHEAQQLNGARVFGQAVRMLTDEVSLQHGALDVRHVLVIGKGRLPADGQIVGIMVAVALDHFDKLEDDGVRIRVGKELDVVDLEVVALLVADKDAAVAVKDISARGGDGPFGVGDLVAQVVILLAFDDLKAVEEGQIQHQNQNHQHDHGDNSSGFDQIIHTVLLLFQPAQAGGRIINQCGEGQGPEGLQQAGGDHHGGKGIHGRCLENLRRSGDQQAARSRPHIGEKAAIDIIV